MKKNIVVAKILLFIIFIVFLLLLFYFFFLSKPYVEKYSISKEYNQDKTVDVALTINSFNKKNIFCKFKTKNNESDYIKVKNNKCTSSITTGDYKIIIKYDNDKKVIYNKHFNIDKVISIDIKDKRKYIALNDSYNINANIEYVGEVDTNIKYESSNPSVISIDEKGNITSLNEGESIISAETSNKLKDTFTIYSTGLIRKKLMDNNKEIVPCNSYTNEQIAMLDDILDSKVEAAGRGTRAGVATAARFLPLEFPYKVPYFYENGRLSDNGLEYTVDGEGRWYHKGLYLGEAKELSINNVLSGPASWGCPLTNWQNDGGRVAGNTYPNGFDCSGYVSWILYNGGLDPGDIGAGISDINDMTDLGELNYISYDLLHSGKVHIGDLIGWNGHIAVIADLTDTSIYVTESLLPGVVLDEYDITSPYSNFYSRYSYIIDLSNVYSGDGNLQNMW